MIPASAFVAVLGLAWSAQAQLDPFMVDEPPSPDAICPAIVDDYQSCSSGGSTSDCQSFVTAAQALGRLYLFTVEREPGKAQQLQTTVWWPCGAETLVEIAALLEKIDSPQARSTLASEPYRSVRGPHSKPSATPAVQPPAPAPITAIDCESPLTDEDRATCDQRLLAIAQANHTRIYDACLSLLYGQDSSRLEADEQSWKADMKAQCDDTVCMRQSLIQRDAQIVDVFPQCGAPVEHPYTAGITQQAKTGMLTARWVPAKGQPEEVPFSYEATKKSRGEMFTTLGKGGEHFHGGYVRVEASSKDGFAVDVYNGWAIPDWAAFGPDGGVGWVATGVSWDEFVKLYTGQVVASLEGDRGHHIRCKLQLQAPQVGLAGGGNGVCQISDGGTLEMSF